jgi:hypothetical protein
MSDDTDRSRMFAIPDSEIAHHCWRAAGKTPIRSVPALLVIPRAYLGLLGIAPILIGTKKFLDLYRQRDRTEETLGRHSYAGAYGRVATVALVTMVDSSSRSLGDADKSSEYVL